MLPLTDELRNVARDPAKDVVLIAGPCGICGRSREDALLPLLTQDALDVWSYLVLDDTTALECLR